MGRPSLYAVHIGAEILAFLKDSVPFIAVAADRAKVPRERVYAWIRDGERPDCKNTDLIDFAQRVRQIRGEWVAKAMGRLQLATRDTDAGCKHTAWLLSRLDRDLFDPPKSVAKEERDATEAKQAPSPTDDRLRAAAQRAAADLALPEDYS